MTNFLKRDEILQSIFEILSSLKEKLPTETYASIKLDFDHNEYAVGFETLCEQIFEYSVQISNEQYNTLFKLCKLMHIDMRYVHDLKNLVK